MGNGKQYEMIQGKIGKKGKKTKETFKTDKKCFNAALGVLVKKMRKNWQIVSDSEESEDEEVKSKKKKKQESESLPPKPVDDKCPKKPMNSYFLYAKAVRKITKQEFPQKTASEIAQEISNKWNAFTEEEKAPWNLAAAGLQKKYKSDIEKYHESNDYITYKKKLDEWKNECDRKKRKVKKESDQITQKKNTKVVLTEDMVDSMKLNELKVKCKELGLKQGGNKKDLQERLKQMKCCRKSKKKSSKTKK